MSSDERPPGKDVLLVGGPTGNGDGVGVIRAREGSVEIGELRSPKEGEAIKGDLVRLKPRPEHERLFDVETLVAHEEGQGSRSGPPKVASTSYRNNWDSVFARSRKQELLN